MILNDGQSIPGFPDISATPARLAALVLLSVLLLGAGFLIASGGVISLGLIVAGLSALAVAAAMAGLSYATNLGRNGAQHLLSGFISRDVSPSFIADSDGVIHSTNHAAKSRFERAQGNTMAATLKPIFANPSAVLFRLQSRAQADGGASEDIVTRRGHLRLSVHYLGAHGFLWRFEDISAAFGARGRDNVPLPMMTVGKSGTILFMNAACRQFVGERAKSLDRLFLKPPQSDGALVHISTKEGAKQALLHERDLGLGRREIYLIPYEGAEKVADSGSLDYLPVPLVRLTQSGDIVRTNGLAQDLIGFGLKPGAALADLTKGIAKPVAEWVADVASGKSRSSTEFLQLLGGERETFVQMTLSPIKHDDQGTTNDLIAVLNDATELKSLEAQFVQGQKMQAIGQLAGGVAHDFNNLLTAISGHCDLLLLRHDQGDPDYGDLVQIHQNANRAAALVGQLLAFSRKQTLRPEVLDLRDTLADLTHLLNRLVGEKVTLTLSHDPVLRAIRADKRQLEQVLMNLVVNARDAMPSGGEIRIETEVVNLEHPMERDRATVPPGDYVCVRVQDEGVGIPPDQVPKVFEPFFTTKRTGEGTGLGLSTVYGIVKQTGGFIFVDSVPGNGTCFSLFFPLDEAVPEPVNPQPMPVKPAPEKQGEGVVLLVEDEAPVRAFASRALRLRGYTVIEAESAEAALKTLEDPELTVDVFVTDVVMPGMDGPSWVRMALQERPEVRVVFVSGYAEGALGEEGLAVPNSVFLPKPFSLNQLTETVHQQFH